MLKRLIYIDLKNFFTDQSQTVKINSITVDEMIVNCGVGTLRKCYRSAFIYSIY